MSVQWDSRECPGPTTEAELSRPSTRRVLTAGALVLAVIAPTTEPAELGAQAGPTAQPFLPAVVQAPDFAFDTVLSERPVTGQRISRSALRGIRLVRRAAPIRKVTVRRALKRPAEATIARSAHRQISQSVTVRRSAAHRSTHRTRWLPRRTRTAGARGTMSAVLAFARAQVGKNYVTGGDGPTGFDCSGFTQRAYARAGLRLPHSSSAQAARARSVSRSQARPGDLVVGAGHVGVYMGGGMMIDAGNHRVGVVYRHLYAGLHVERF